MSNKLHIPGSADTEDLNELNMVLVLGWAVCMLLCIGLFLFFRDRRPDAGRVPDTAQAAVEENTAPKTALEENIEAFRFGPRELAEQACLKLRPKLADGTLPAEVDLELLKVLERRADYAPWSCLLGAYLEDGLSSELQTYEQIADFWVQAQTFFVPPEVVASTLKRFYLSKTTPKNFAFSRWLRLCGMTPNFQARPACMQLMRRSETAEFGADVLEMVELHLEITDDDTLVSDMPTVAAGLGDFSADGQPDTWLVSETEAIEDYNQALRIGAAFMLCRIVNSPDEDAAGAAALGLAKAANMGARAADSKMVRRWRETCQLVFYPKPAEAEGMVEEAKEDGAEEDAAAADTRTLQERLDTSRPTPTGAHFLAVWNGQEDSPPDYTLRGAIERGACPEPQERPAWYCALSYWRGDAQKSFDLNLQSLFVKTSYIEWLED